MLKNAKSYETELQERAYETWYNLKYQFYYSGNYFNEIRLDDDSRWTFVSVNEYEEVTGVISFQVSNDTKCVRNFGVMSFYDGLNIEFARDVAGLINDIFYKYHFNRMEWYCIDGNPALRSYKEFCKRHGGTVMAHEHECVRTLDGQLRDSYGFEILAKNYIQSRERVYKGNGRRV